MALFRAKTDSDGKRAGVPRSSRHSSGWVQLSKHLNAAEGLRILDIGITSAGNINFITNLGHSVYMANLVEDASRPEYLVMDAEGKSSFDVPRYLSENLDFAGRTFNVVTLWDTIDYLPEPLVAPVIDRLAQVIEGGGRLLAFFHSRLNGEDTNLSRYHLTATDQLEMQTIAIYPILHTYTTRQIETLFSRFASHKFFLAKDTLREVIVIR